MPPFIDGSSFYSFDIDPGNGDFVYDMVVDPSGYIWVVGGGNYLYKYDRFGGAYLDRVNIGAVSSLRVGMDSAGNLYVMTDSTVSKIDGVTHAVTSIITGGAGQFYDMAVDPNFNMIYLLTNDLTASQAVKKYNTSGTLQTTWGTINLSLGAVTGGIFQTIQGIGVNKLGTVVYVASGTPLNISGAWSSDVQQFTTAGVYAGLFPLGLNTEYNDIKLKPILDANGVANILTVTSKGSNFSPQPSNMSIVNDIIKMPKLVPVSPPLGQLGISSDPNGAGIYAGLGKTIYRLAGGSLSPYQALECYLGAAGLGGVNNGRLNYTNLSTAQLNVFDGGYFPAWRGNLWNLLKQLGATRRFSIMGSSDNTINVTSLVNPLPRLDINDKLPGSQRSIKAATSQSFKITTLDTTTSRQVGSFLYKSTPVDQVISADYNEINVVTVGDEVHAVSIDQPSELSGTTWNSTESVYMVTDSSNPPILLSQGQFSAYGGKVTATPSQTLGRIDVTMYGPKVAIPNTTGPFSLAYPVGSQKIPALQITGNAVLVNSKELLILTGAIASNTSEVDGPVISSPFISSQKIAYDTSNPVAIDAGHGEDILSIEMPLTNQQLGTIAGSIFLYDRVKWIVSSAKISDGIISIEARRFTTIFDVTPNNPTMTVGQMDTLWSGYRVQDRFISPGIVFQ